MLLFLLLFYLKKYSTSRMCSCLLGQFRFRTAVKTSICTQTASHPLSIKSITVFLEKVLNFNTCTSVAALVNQIATMLVELDVFGLAAGNLRIPKIQCRQSLRPTSFVFSSVKHFSKSVFCACKFVFSITSASSAICNCWLLLLSDLTWVFALPSMDDGISESPSYAARVLLSWGDAIGKPGADANTR